MHPCKYTLPFSLQWDASCFHNLLGLLFLIGFLIPHPSYAVNLSDFNLPPQDAIGWTILVPEANSRIVYVDSSSGSDSTGQVYSPSDSIIGSNPQLPSGPVQAFKTLAAAHSQLRDDAPDWMLLKSGEIWRNESLSLRRGESATKRAVVSSYGSGARPELRTGTLPGISSRQASNIIISGIKFWAHTRDTDGLYFLSYDGTVGFDFVTRAVGDSRIVSDILIEECIFRAYTNNVITGATQDSGNTPVSRVVIRRSIISGNYSTTSHAQGLFHTANGQSSTVPAAVLLEENLFDHNGWRIQSTGGGADRSDGQATYFNHNTYFEDAKKVLFSGNLFLRASSIHNKWTANLGLQSSSEVVVDNNLYAEGEVGMSVGGNTAGAHRFHLFEIKNNVLTDIGRSHPTNRSLAWYIEIMDWDNGQIAGNLLLNQTAGIGNTYAIKIIAQDGTQQVDVKNNDVFNMEADSALVKFHDGENSTNVNFTDNAIQAPHSGPVVEINARGGYQFNGNNKYFSNGDPEMRFVINNNRTNLDNWINYTGDKFAAIEQSGWNDPDRNLERYASEVGLGNSFNNFIDALYKQSKSNWRSDLTAAEINEWFRAGFVINGANAPPTASYTATCAELACQFDASGSTDADGSIFSYEWDFGDGNTSATQNPSYIYASAGTYTVILTVTDNDGTTAIAIDTVIITILPPPLPNQPPTANAGADQTVSDSDGTDGEDVTLEGSGSSDSDGTISNYTWNWRGNSTTGVNPMVILPDGSTVVTLTVTDDDGATAADTTTITVEAPLKNNPPTANAGLDQAVMDSDDTDGENVTLDGSGSSDSGGTISYAWNWNGGNANGVNPMVRLPDGTTVVTLTVTDDERDTAEDTVLFTIEAPPPPVTRLNLNVGIVAAVNNGDWTLVKLPQSYNSMVVVASANYNSSTPPLVTRIRNASGNSFELRVDRADNSTDSIAGVDVHYMVIEEGIYNFAEHGVTLEAVKFNSTLTDENNSWGGQSRSYANAYSNPVVLGQVMTYNDSDWSVFWARGESRRSPPSTSSLAVGKHVGEDSDTTRANETIGYIVIENGNGAIEGKSYTAALGADNIRGMDNHPPYSYSIATPKSNPAVAVISAAAMDGRNGGWPILYGANPLSASSLNLAIDEDQKRDSEQKHTSEQVAYILFE